MSASATCQINRTATETSGNTSNSSRSDGTFDNKLQEERSKLDEKQRLLSGIGFGQLEALFGLSPMTLTRISEKVLPSDRSGPSITDREINDNPSKQMQGQQGNTHAEMNKRSDDSSEAKLTYNISQSEFVSNMSQSYGAPTATSLFEMRGLKMALAGGPDLEMVISDIVDKVKLVKEGRNTTLSLHIRPEGEGDLLLDISMRNGSIFISILADPDSRKWLDMNMAALEESLKRANVNIGGLSVSCGAGQQNDNRNNSSETAFSIPGQFGFVEAPKIASTGKPVADERLIGMFTNNWIFFKV